MKCLFISDVHYPFGRSVIRFLLKKFDKYDAIYILGDLFEFFYGYGSFLYPQHLQLINVLKFVSTKTQITIFEGNHEYRLEKIRDFIDVRIIKESLIETLGNNTVFMAHGDTIDKLDISYRFFRASLKNRFMLSLIGKIPPSRLLYLSRLASRISKENLKSKKYRGTEKALENFAFAKLKEEVDVVILGHTHTPVFKKLNGGLYINSGEFFNRFSYVTFDGSEFNLHFWEARDDEGRG